MDEKEYSLIEHLAELRKRLARALIGVGLIAIAAFAVSDELLAFLRAPMESELHSVYGPTARFITMGAAEYFFCQMKAALVAGIFLASPWVLYQIWLFIAPGLYDHEKRYVTSFVWAGAGCFVGGAAFAYAFVFPPMYHFFLTNQPAEVQMMPGLDENFSFALKTLLGFAVVFETPVVIFILSLAGIVDPASLGRYRRYVIVVAFIVGAVLTPSPDPLSQALLAGPLLVLWEVGILVSRLVVKAQGTPLSRKERAEKHAEKHAAEHAAEHAEKHAAEAEKLSETQAGEDDPPKS